MPISDAHKNRLLYVGLPALLVLLVIVLRSLFFTTYRMKGEAMHPLIRSGKILYVSLQAQPTPGKLLLLRSRLSSAESKQTYVARLIACPGDTLRVANSQVWINGSLQPMPSYWSSTDAYELVLPRAQTIYPLTALSLVSYRKAIAEELASTQDRAADLSPSDEELHPRPAFEAGKLYIDGKEQKSFRFQRDYYWVLCDNQLAGPDSRHFGIIPADKILGSILGY